MFHVLALRETEERIEETRRWGKDSLDLSGVGITTLPDTIGQLTHLRSLNLSRNELTELPESIGQLRHLESLNLFMNSLVVIPDSIGRLQSLQELNLFSNKLVEIPESLGGLSQLQSLLLHHNQLVKMPEALGELKMLESMNLSHNRLMILPDSVGRLTMLRWLNLSHNQLTTLPLSFGQLAQLQHVSLLDNKLTALPRSLGNLSKLNDLDLRQNMLNHLPDEMGQISELRSLCLSDNQLTDLPGSIGHLRLLTRHELTHNPLNPELAAAYEEGFSAVQAYLRAKAAAQITLNEAKLILVGEGGVGKSCLLDALLDNPWKEKPTTHGIDISPIRVTDPYTETELTLNGWDFGGQRVYRPTHQLFFSAPAVYLVVWKPREGPQQGFVKEWIQLIKRREPTAKILVVATHGGPQQRQPDIDRQELWDLFDRDTVLDFFHVDSKPDENGRRRGIEDLKRAIARVAATLPEVGRSVPKRWKEMREELTKTGRAYLPWSDVIALCRSHQMDDDEARLFIAIEHRLGHLIHYQHDPTLRDIVVLKPDWLATAISYVLDDEATRRAHGLVRLTRLSQLWDDPTRPADSRYPSDLHPIFLRLMERFDLSYRMADPSSRNDSDPLSLIAQLVPDIRPSNLGTAWPSTSSAGDLQQTQICRIVEVQSGISASAEGMFYQLIVRLHRYSLGRFNYDESVHWQRGLVLDYDFNGRALLEHLSNDVRITVRAPYPERFLVMLTEEVKYLVESFWEGLRCDVTVPCLNPIPCTGLFEVRKLIDNLKRDRPEVPCSICNEWQPINQLLHNAPVAHPYATTSVFAEFNEVKAELAKVSRQISSFSGKAMGRFDRLDDRTRRILSQVEDAYFDLLQVLTDEAKEGPRLFSIAPVDRNLLDPRRWTSAQFRLTLWCEHSRLPLPALNGKKSKKGIYTITLTHEWFKKAAPFLKVLTGTLSLVLPVAAAGIELALDDVDYKAIEEQLDFGKEVIDASLEASTEVSTWLGGKDTMVSLEHGEAIRANGAMLREMQAILKAKDPGFGGLVRVMNKRQEFLWVHPQFEKEY